MKKLKKWQKSVLGTCVALLCAGGIFWATKDSNQAEAFIKDFPQTMWLTAPADHDHDYTAYRNRDANVSEDDTAIAYCLNSHLFAPNLGGKISMGTQSDIRVAKWMAFNREGQLTQNSPVHRLRVAKPWFSTNDTFWTGTIQSEYTQTISKEQERAMIAIIKAGYPINKDGVTINGKTYNGRELRNQTQYAIWAIRSPKNAREKMAEKGLLTKIPDVVDGLGGDYDEVYDIDWNKNPCAKYLFDIGMKYKDNDDVYVNTQVFLYSPKPHQSSQDTAYYDGFGGSNSYMNGKAKSPLSYQSFLVLDKEFKPQDFGDVAAVKSDAEL